MILVVGAGGLLGAEFKQRLRKEDAYFATSADIDITQIDTIYNYVKKKEVRYIINCAASRNAELIESDHVLARNVNVCGAANLAIVANDIQAGLVHFSTDYVFDGSKSSPYTEQDIANPLSVYGLSKLEGENQVLDKANKAIVIRTSWLLSIYGRNFIKTIYELAKKKSELNVVFDQVGSPTCAGDLAEIVLQLLPYLNVEKKELYHISNYGVCSWYDLAVFIVEQFDLPCKINPVHSSEYPTSVVRPSYSVLDCSKIVKEYGVEIKHYHHNLRECINLLKNDTTHFIKTAS